MKITQGLRQVRVQDEMAIPVNATNENSNTEFKIILITNFI